MIQISKVSNISPNRILIIQTAFLGDVILTLPLLQKTKNLFPESKIDFITIPASRNLLETHPDINELLIYDKHKTEGGFLNFVKWINKIRNSNYDLALVPHRSIRSALMAIPAKQRIGFNRSAGKIFFNQIIQYQKDRHEINRNLFLLKPFGVDPDEKVFPKINFTKSDSLVVSQWKKNLKLKSTSKIIAVAPGSVWATKRWTLEGYCKVINDLCKRGFTVVLIGGEDDVLLGRQIEDKVANIVYNAMGKFTLRESALLIKESLLLLTNDSAPQHLAAAVGTPVVTIFGPTVPSFGFYPYGSKDGIVEIKDLVCRPCSIHGGNKCPIGTFECMKKIDPVDVIKQVEGILRNNPESEPNKLNHAK